MPVGASSKIHVIYSTLKKSVPLHIPAFFLPTKFGPFPTRPHSHFKIDPMQRQVMQIEGSTIYARGCTERKTECQNLCYNGENYEICESCCFANLCNSARPLTPNAAPVVFSIVIALIARYLM